MRRIVSITGSRADYGLMSPVHRLIAAEPAMELHLLVTGMHFAPPFASALAEVRADRLGTLHEAPVALSGRGGRAMAQAVAEVVAAARLLEEIRADVLLLQGDRGEMLGGAIAAAHMNIPIVHMSGGDRSGSVDDALRNAISKLAHVHLTSCRDSSRRLRELGEAPARIVEVGDPGVDQVRLTEPLPIEPLRAELGLEAGAAYILATLHPVTDEAAAAATQMSTLLEGLSKTGMAVVFTHPNTDAGGEAMRQVLESWRERPWLRIHPNLGSRRYLSALRHAAAIVGNSSSGLIEAPSLGVPAINVGERQHGRTRGANVLDVDFDAAAIADAIRFALTDRAFRGRLAARENPYGDGHAAERTLEVLRRLDPGPELVAKWRAHTHAA